MAPVELVLVMQEVTVVRSLWPVAEDFPVRGEIDQEAGTVTHGATQWSAYALEWTPSTMNTTMQPESVPAELSLAPGDPATGQPSDYPQRAPRRLG